MGKQLRLFFPPLTNYNQAMPTSLINADEQFNPAEVARLNGDERGKKVRGMFQRIHRRYDLLNRVLSWGMDQGWRRQAVQMLELGAGMCVLDVGAGTGDISLEIARQRDDVEVTASDFTQGMAQVGVERCDGGKAIQWMLADACWLPIQSESYDRVISAFVLRNVGDLQDALWEQYRILVPRGRMVCLDNFPPRKNWLYPLITLYLRLIVPVLGFLLAGNSAAYKYWQTTVRGYIYPEQLAKIMRRVGYVNVQVHRMWFGLACVVRGDKPEDDQSN